MRVLNIMLGRKAGGIEQASVDYAEALQRAGHETFTVTSTDAWVNRKLDDALLPRISFSNMGYWDPIAAYKLRQIARAAQAEIAISHGNRALKIGALALRGICPLSYVTHNYNIKHIRKADLVFTITRALALEAELAGTPPEHIFHIPNMVRIPDALQPHTLYQRPPVIGTMGRMVRNKGFDVLLRAAAIMNARGLQFSLRIGGDGEERAALEALTQELGIRRTVTFTGWIENPKEFYNAIDIFVLPSHHEPFGIVLIEAMCAGLACITTDAEGPSEIVHHGEDALMVPRHDPEAMALAIERVLTDHALAAELAAKGQELVAKHYSMDAMARRLHEALQSVPHSSIEMAA